MTAPPKLTTLMAFTRSGTGHWSTFMSPITLINTSPSTKGNTLAHLELIVLDSTDQREAHHTNRITLKKMMSETITPDTFDPPLHKLSAPIQDSLKLLFQEYKSQFAKDETSIGTTPLRSMTIDTGTADPVSQKPYPIAMKHYEWVKNEIEKLLTAKVICTSCSSWSAPIIVVPKGDRGKCLVIDYRALNKVTREFTWPMPKKLKTSSPS